LHAIDDQLVQRDLLLLLISLAWADHELAVEEINYVRDVAIDLGFEGPDLTEVDSWLTRLTPLPPPNMTRLAAHRDVALKAAARVITADGKVVADEAELLRQVAAMLAAGAKNN